MTLDDVLKLMAASTPIVLGILAYFTAIANRNAVRADRNAVRAATNAATAAEQVQSTLAATTDATSSSLTAIADGQGEIHKLVNNQLSEAVERVKIAQEEIAELKRLLSTQTGKPAPPPPPRDPHE